MYRPPQGGLYPSGGHLGGNQAPRQPGDHLSGQQRAGLRAWPGADRPHGRQAGVGGLQSGTGRPFDYPGNRRAAGRPPLDTVHPPVL